MGDHHRGTEPPATVGADRRAHSSVHPVAASVLTTVLRISKSLARASAMRPLEAYRPAASGLLKHPGPAAERLIPMAMGVGRRGSRRSRWAALRPQYDVVRTGSSPTHIRFPRSRPIRVPMANNPTVEYTAAQRAARNEEGNPDLPMRCVPPRRGAVRPAVVGSTLSLAHT